ncbi:peroxiredoxin [Blastococcus sp. CT_GayMR16]|uniref:peroxiredoxin n=1 Tax=Blastococcus sp. CT_GayMR16 TaxID=2559607 RepID=UPI0010744234|nr:peroxiredoxin [Blastococcus sp. CT_GayMR16]TFV87975.1 peroxiredoxin [Blastococcus sp. CT_GayMR16]
MKRTDMAPDFELPDQFGVLRRLSTMLQDGPVALFFYPVASSGGCTTEMCAVRDRSAEFQAVGAQRVGISRDPVAAQLRFAESNGLDFPLLSDGDGTVCAAYGVGRSMAAAPVKRHTIVIGTDGRVTDVVKSEFRFGKHAAKALDALRSP